MKLELSEVKEHEDKGYPARTRYNAFSANTTLALAVDLNTRREILTKKLAGKKYIGFQLLSGLTPLDVARGLYVKMKKDNADTLNIAGNGIYTLIKHNCNQAFINQFVYEVVAQVNSFHPIRKIYTGGQTGVDIAGAVAAYALEIPAEITLPANFMQRFEDNIDVWNDQSFVEKQIIQGALYLKNYDVVTKPKSKVTI